MGEPVDVMPYDPAWPAMLAKRGAGLRTALGDTAVRIDHIGSTSVPGLAAKPVIDIQISVTVLEPAEEFLGPLTGMGFVYRAANPERTKRYFREPPGRHRTHVHVRQLGTFSQQFPLLFRDYLRCHTSAAAAYAEAKRRCAARFRDDRPGYVQAKDDFVRDIIRRADAWAQRTGWTAGPSDA
ncbi:GrpB family protein [Streptomyces sp. NPDC012794]|uniref:GrpB family protein n=1 Tax=Streptomyces sp. NPDC012794 TaxID=3364850 RepID=UPI0036B6F860